MSGEAPEPEAAHQGSQNGATEVLALAPAQPVVRATLTRLRIAGFKSFAEATNVEILPGLTGIVGPNGCGKSNVVEALRWGMGESSARSLRGGEMDDVIFAGTANRPGRNIAEVIMTLEDAAGMAPSPFSEADELELSRRIERGAGSSFRINGKEMRARDVQTMFADIGAGARASGMVSQGRVATLIHAKPEERRAVLEEAAGIAGLRARRHEAELKLRQAEGNLTRADDLLAQLETQKQGLQRQAKQANRYRNISGLVRQAEAEWLALLRARAQAAEAHFLAELDAAQANAATCEPAAEAAAEHVIAAEQALPGPRLAEAEARTALERRRIELEGLEAEERRAAEALAEAGARLAQITQDLAHAERAAADAVAADRALSAEDTVLARLEEGLPQQVEVASAALAVAADAAREAELEANIATERAARLAAQVNQASQDMAAAERVASRLTQRLGEARAEYAAAEAANVPQDRVASARSRVIAARETLASRRTALAQAEARTETAARALTDARRTLEDAEASRARAAQALTEATDRVQRLAQQRDQIARDLASAQEARISAGRVAAAEAAALTAEEALRAARADVEAKEAHRAVAQQRHAEARRNLADADATRARLLADRAVVQQRSKDLAAQLKAGQDEYERLAVALVPDARVQDMHDRRLQAEQHVEAVRSALERAEAERADTGALNMGARNASAEARAKLDRLTAEVEALSQTLGTPDGATGERAIADDVVIPPGLEAAVSAALGDALESPGDEAAARYWRDMPRWESAPRLPTGLVPLGDVVNAPPALRRALSQIGLMPDDGDGSALQLSLAPGQTVVTSEGAVWRWDGYTGTAKAPNTELVRLRQRARLRSAEGLLAAARSAVAVAADHAAETEAAEARAISAESAARRARSVAEDALAKARQDWSELSAQAEQALARLSACDMQLERLKPQVALAADALAHAERALGALPDTALLASTASSHADDERRALASEQQARQVRQQAEASWQAARSEASRLASAASLAESRVQLLQPQLDQVLAEYAEATTRRDGFDKAVAALSEIAALRSLTTSAAECLAAAQAEQATIRHACAHAEAELAEATTASASLEVMAAEASSRLLSLAPQLERLAAEAAEASANVAALRSSQATLPDLADLRESVEAARGRLSTVRAEELAARDAVSTLQTELSRVSARRAALAVERAGWSSRLNDAQGRVGDLRRRHADSVEAEAYLALVPGEIAERKAEARELLSGAEASHASAKSALAAAEAMQRESVEARRLADAAFASAREALLRAEAAVGQAQAAAAAIEDRVVERLGEGAELPPPGELSDAAEDRARRKLDRLTREREEMGPVNLRSEVELEEVEARADGITRERDEITAAIAKLRSSVGNLNREGRERLRAIFSQVDLEFQRLFNRLFGGGRAHLALVGSDDVLEAGLEIFAEPPGKKLAALSLLSGGEQALTALSLIFAVFKCQPAPVCVLDEVDAPLDDANVERLCDLLDHMAAEGGTRFLIVTHHPLTMARMHRLYGVTMQERGVSRLLSVDLARAVELAEGPKVD